jgi:hypothetical protein
MNWRRTGDELEKQLSLKGDDFSSLQFLQSLYRLENWSGENRPRRMNSRSMTAPTGMLLREGQKKHRGVGGFGPRPRFWALPHVPSPGFWVRAPSHQFPIQHKEKTQMPRRPKQQRRGRPTRALAAERAAAALKALGVDFRTADPEMILRAIACDTSAPAAARVAACRTLLGLGDAGDGSGKLARADVRLQEVNALAIQLLTRGRAN